MLFSQSVVESITCTLPNSDPSLCLGGSNKRSSYNSWRGMLSHVLTLPPLSFRIERVIIMNGRFFSDRSLNPKLHPPSNFSRRGQQRDFLSCVGAAFSYFSSILLAASSINFPDVKICCFLFYFDHLVRSAGND